MGRLSQRVAIVTGGRGIGRGIVLGLAEAGADIAIADVDVRGARRKLAEEVASLGREVIVCQVDVTDTQSVQRGVDQILARFHRIDILVNNAGVVQDHTGSEVTGDDFDRCYMVNLRGIWNVSSVVISHFRERGGGKIVNIASIAGRRETTAWRPTRPRRPARSA